MRTQIDIENKHLILSHSSAAMMHSCPRKFFHNYVEGIKKVPSLTMFRNDPPDDVALVFGTAIHSALSILYTQHDVVGAQEKFLEIFLSEGPSEEDPVRSPGNGVKLLGRYWSLYKNIIEEWDHVESEAEILLRLPGYIDNSGDRWTIDYTGYIDQVLRHKQTGVYRLIDHKTTKFMSSAQIRAFELGQQFQGYIAAFKEVFREQTFDMLIDLLVINRKEGSFNLTQQIILHDTFLQREWRKDIYATAENIILNARKDYWPKHTPGPCCAFNKDCDYLDICTSNQASIKTVRTNSFTDAIE